MPLFCAKGLPPAEPSGVYALRLPQPAASRTRLLLALLKDRFGPVPPWDLALQAGFGKQATQKRQSPALGRALGDSRQTQACGAWVRPL